MLLRRGTSRTLSKQGLSSERGPGHERGNKRGRLRRWGVPPTPALRRAGPGKAGSTERVSQPQRPRLSTAKGRMPAPASGGVRPSSELRFPGAPPQPASRAAAPGSGAGTPLANSQRCCPTGENYEAITDRQQPPQRPRSEAEPGPRPPEPQASSPTHR